METKWEKKKKKPRLEIEIIGGNNARDCEWFARCCPWRFIARKEDKEFGARHGKRGDTEKGSKRRRFDRYGDKITGSEQAVWIKYRFVSHANSTRPLRRGPARKFDRLERTNERNVTTRDLARFRVYRFQSRISVYVRATYPSRLPRNMVGMARDTWPTFTCKYFVRTRDTMEKRGKRREGRERKGGTDRTPRVVLFNNSKVQGRIDSIHAKNEVERGGRGKKERSKNGLPDNGVPDKYKFVARPNFLSSLLLFFSFLPFYSRRGNTESEDGNE